ncbi:unnamed protein product [Lactuca virosa]|uniref:Uncharacterized protein n=1 Tax=Lactuca virosa TaxID=75947 RepID=A0AAU9NF90_9ASTR|nr:unnamed protein product [Lactuca virosa]
MLSLKIRILDVYQTYYEALFRDTVAVGDKAKVPCEFGDGSTLDDVYSSKKKRGKKLTPRRDNKRKFERKSEGKSMVSSSYEEKLDTVFDVLLTRSTQPSRQTTHSPKTEDCMAIVSTFPDFVEGSIGYLEALEVFLKKPARHNFLVPKTNETKMEFLKRLIEKEK